MGRKIDSFRRTRSRETICPVTERFDSANHHIAHSNTNDNDSANNNNNNNNNNNIDIHQLSKMHLDEKTSKRLPGACQRSPSPFKSFFIRMGSTGMLNTTNRSNRRSQNVDERLRMPDKESLFRSCSTSQLNYGSPTYVKGDDPSEGIDLRVAARKDKTSSCDDLASSGHHGNGSGPDYEARARRGDLSACAFAAYPLGSPAVSLSTCDLGRAKDDESSMRKSSSCDLKEIRKSSFPYAFLRSKLSVLPEERHGALMQKDERLFKTVSEEHFPTLKIEDPYIPDATTTLGRKRPSRLGIGNGIGWNDCTSNRESLARPEYQRRDSGGYEDVRYGLNASGLPNHDRVDAFQRQENTAVVAHCYGLFDANLSSLRENPEFRRTAITTANAESVHKGTSPCTSGSRIEPEMNTTDLDAMALRSKRRNSASSSCEQRLSSHYVSSNESGYDSDGPRGESVAISENEGSKCISDTGSLLDAEAQRLARSSTPSECRESARRLGGSGETTIERHPDENRSDLTLRVPPIGDIERLDGLKWHRSGGSGRILPSIHVGTSLDEIAISQLGGMDSRRPLGCENRHGPTASAITKPLDASPHRVRLQQDKTRFLSDIIQPLMRVRRRCLIQLHKRDPKESLGIRLAQQRLADTRYVVVQLESDGIAHRDGRLRLGDEIVEVEGKQLRTLESLEKVQEFLKSFTGNSICLTIAYDEAVPQVQNDAPPSVLPGEYEYLENARNLSGMSLIENEASHAPSMEQKTTDNDVAESVQSRKRPDYLSLSCLPDAKRNADAGNSESTATELSQNYLTRHVARFEKGYGKPSLGFSVVGGRDSPRGDMGIFVRRVFPGGQADISRSLFQGDEILSLNGKILKGRTHQEVIELFKTVREGVVELEITRRHRFPRSTLKSAPY